MFFSTKHSAHSAKILFGLAGLPQAAELHGNMTQAARLESLEKFRKVPNKSACLLILSHAFMSVHLLQVAQPIIPSCVPAVFGDASASWPSHAD